MPKQTATKPAPPKLPLRRCRYCKGKYEPKRVDQHFCQPNHRKLYHRYGALPLNKLLTRVEKETRRMIGIHLQELTRRIEALEARHPAAIPYQLPAREATR